MNEKFQHSPLCSGNGLAPNPGCSCGLVAWLYREAEREMGAGPEPGSAARTHEIIRRIQDALPHGEHSIVAPLYPTWEAATRIYDALRPYIDPPYSGAARRGAGPESPASEEAELKALGDFVTWLSDPKAREERLHLMALVRHEVPPSENCGVCYSLRKALVRARGGAGS